MIYKIPLPSRYLTLINALIYDASGDFVWIIETRSEHLLL